MKIVYRVEERYESEWVYNKDDVIGIDNLKCRRGPSWWAVVKYRDSGKRYHGGEWILDEIKEYSRRFITFKEAQRFVKRVKVKRGNK